VGREGSDYHREIILPGSLRLLGPKRGERALDVGCGQGIFARTLAGAGSDVTGIDASPSLVEKARSYAGPARANYLCASAEQMIGIKDHEYDIVSAILCVQNMRDLPGVAIECARVIAPGGRMLWVVNHPCFRIPRQSSWGWDESKKMQYRRIDHYKSQIEIPIQMHPGKNKSETTTSFHRPIEELIGIPCRAGFVLSGIEEWCSTKNSEPGPSARSENRARREFPLFMALLFRAR